MASSAPAEEGDAAAALPGKDAAFGSGGTVRLPGRLRVVHPHVAELLRSPRRHARPAANPASRPTQQTPGRERARYACAFEDDGVRDVAAPGRLVWGNPWWPGQVFDAADASSAARAHRTPREAVLFFSKACIARASLREVRVKIQGPGDLTASCHRPTLGGTQTIITGSNGREAVLVAYFWDKTFAWNDAAALLPFRAGFPRLAAMAPVAAAVDAALAEVARRVAAGLSCSCDCGAGANRQVIDNAGVRDGAYGEPVDAAFARGALQAKALVGYVSALATNPRAVADRVDLAVAAAQLEALGRWRGSTRGLPEHTVVHGIGGVTATAKRRRSSTAGGGGDGSASAKRRVTTRNSRSATKGTTGQAGTLLW